MAWSRTNVLMVAATLALGLGVGQAFAMPANGLVKAASEVDSVVQSVRCVCATKVHHHWRGPAYAIPYRPHPPVHAYAGPAWWVAERLHTWGDVGWAPAWGPVDWANDWANNAYVAITFTPAP
jgi:hypothetical protein